MVNFPWGHVHFVGIGGAGMAPLASLLLQKGVNVTGSDLEGSQNTQLLQKAGAEISIGHSGYIPGKPDLLVYSAAVKAKNEDRVRAEELSIPQMKRGDFLGEVASHYENVIAVAGSHGKTTVTTMLAHVFRLCGVLPDFVIGGKPMGGLPFASAGSGKYFITEADESDLSLTALNPTVSVVINVEDDHSWNVGGRETLFKGFQKFSNAAESLVYGSGEFSDKLFADHKNFHRLIYGEDEAQVPQAGVHNRFNAAVALKVSELCGLPKERVVEALKNFQGVSRRCTIHAEGGNHIIIEDYAHHPTELREFVKTLNEEYADFQKVIIFQPHRYERVEAYSDEFTNILKTCDHVFITPPFTAWNHEKCHATKDIAERCNGKYFNTNDWEAIAADVVNDCPPFEKMIYAIVGAATVNQVIPYLRNIVRMHEIMTLNPYMELHTDLSWSELTTLSIGSHNPLVALPSSDEELSSLLAYLNKHRIHALPLGCGSNMVGGDEAYDGVIIRLRNEEFNDITISGTDVISGAGVRLSKFVNKVAEAELGGPEALVAIPGSVGGAIRMNAGAQGVEISEFVTLVKGVRLNGQAWSAKGADVEWHYRGSNIPIDVIITQVLFSFETASKPEALSKISETRDFRKKTQPGGKNPGCAFRNPDGDSAGRLIDKFGMKNLSSGDCSVSDIHANFVVNKGNGTEADFANILETVQKEVFNRSGIILRNEVVFSTKREINAVMPLNIVVLKGGVSSEREISITSGEAVAEALRGGGHNVTEIDVIDKSLPAFPENVDVVFPVLHGVFGEDGQVQALLDAAGYKYVGAGVEASKVTIDKFKTVSLLKEHEIEVAESQVLESVDSQLQSVKSFPVVVKPNSQGSTIGMTLVEKEEDLQAAIDLAFTVDEKVLIEEFVAGKETTVGLVFGEALPVVEIIPPEGFFDFDAKYTYSRGETIYNCPPSDISEEVQKRMQLIAKKCFEVTKVRHLSRVDMIYQPESDRIIVLEINTMPGFTASSLLPKSAKFAGISFTELCCSLALEASK
ncbi:MAG: D-alanine--D-alanine ligase [Lentisphaeraceae bacterium]|nr:D-alanine--D-alanine ligase [Lentisphaeraceae bacterium]